MATKFLTVFHTNANCHVCGNVEVHNTPNEAIVRLNKADRQDKEPNGFVIVLDDNTQVLINRFVHGKNQLISAPFHLLLNQTEPS